MSTRKKALIILAVLILVFAGALYYTSRQICKCSEYVYANINEIPAREYGLVLGTARIVQGKYLNQYFQHRINAAAKLYHAGKVKKLILSGDNRQAGYNEPEDMRQTLLAAGVPDNALQLDYAGFRTLDSVIRASNVFKTNSFIVISQHFHCERAVFIAQSHSIDAIGFAAAEVDPRFRFKRFFREPLSRLLTYIDIVILNRQPHFPQ